MKREAATHCYLGGLEDLERVLKHARSNADLYVLPRMSLDDADLVSVKLHAAGMVPGEDFGLFGMFNGALLPCNGIRPIGDERAPFVVEWRVQLDRDYVVPPEAEGYDWQPPEAEERRAAIERVEAQALEVPRSPTAPPRRVVFRTGPVHWAYDDDDEDEWEEAKGGDRSPVETQGGLLATRGTPKDQKRAAGVSCKA